MNKEELEKLMDIPAEKKIPSLKRSGEMTGSFILLDAAGRFDVGTTAIIEREHLIEACKHKDEIIKNLKRQIK